MKRLFAATLFIAFALPLSAQFGPKVLIDSTNYVSELTTADLNGDNAPDIIVCERYLGNRIAYSLNDGSGNMAPLTQLDSMYQPFEIEAGDLNGDGRPEVIAIQGNHPKGLLTIFTNNFPAFPATVIDSVSYIVNFRLTDLDMDGDLDIVVAGDRDLIAMYNDGAMNFTKVALPMPEPENYSMEVADLHNDGLPDLIIGTRGLYIYRNIGGMLTLDSAASASIFPGTGSVFHIAAGDIDKDGFVDVAYTDPPWVRADKNTNGLFSAFTTIDVMNIKNNIVLADADGDGWLDFLAMRAGTNEIFWRRQVAVGQFSPMNVVHVGTFRGSKVFTEDLNGDGLLDLIWCNELAYHLSGTVSVEEGAAPANALSIYPNPAHGAFRIDFPGAGHFQMLSLDGRICFEQAVSAAGSLEFQPNLAAGLYAVHFVDVEGKVFSGRVQIQTQ
ncbi:MAG: T9SS type A sorting domain-containing protein [Bacteroidota bacterium]